KGQDQEFADLLSGLRMVKVRIFKLENSPPQDQVAAGAGKILTALSKKGWETVLRVRDGNDRVDILVQNDGEAVGGLLAFFMDDENAGFVSIDGRFDPAQLGRLASRLSLGPLAGLEVETPPKGTSE
ncbi:MAG: DUF4252 domain-containing protein, partial [Acidobacteria bacterium]|nr:DUF4252 domain-containing protein [Acidobacteriota bacterium]